MGVALFQTIIFGPSMLVFRGVQFLLVLGVKAFDVGRTV